MHPPGRRRLSGAALLAIAVVISAAVAACTGGQSSSSAPSSTTEFTIPIPSGDVKLPTVTAPPGFVPADTRGVRLLGLQSHLKSGPPPLPVYGGTATLTGLVDGPDGPVGGAVVLIERFVGDRSGSVQVSTGGDGRFAARNLLGGRYRVRAWQQPSLAADGSQVTFLADEGGTADLTIDLHSHEGRKLQAGLETTAINVGDSSRIRALLTETTVDGDGIVVSQPVGGAAVNVDLLDADFALGSDNPTTTNTSGLAYWRVTCQREGAHVVTVRAGDLATTVTLPSCGPRPTTTTSLDVPDFPVGRSFTLPYASVLPAGTYKASSAGCDMTYQAYVDGRWTDRQEATGATFDVSTPVRDLQAAAGAPACKYQRTG